MDIVIYTVLGTLVLIGIIAYLINLKNKNDEWEGKLVEKRIETRTDSNDSEQTIYALYIETVKGNNRRVAVRKKVYEQFEVGDQLVKVKGETAPRKK